MNIANLLKYQKREAEVQAPNPYGGSKHRGGNNHNRSESKKRRKMAARSRRINRKRIPRWAH